MHRHSFLRGRLLLAGLRLADLDLRSHIDAAEAVVFEPALNGSFSSIDEMLDRFEQATIEAWARIDRSVWGTSSQAVAGERAMMDLIGGPAKPREQSRDGGDRRGVRSGQAGPEDDGVVR